jgi:sortase B
MEVTMVRSAVRITNSMVNNMVLTMVILLLAFAGYALWDSSQIYSAADRSTYSVYKPTVEDAGKTFQELQAINPEVFAWLTVYDTNIDYPVVQGEENMKYVNTNVEGEYSLSGSIFLDSGNKKDFSDFNSIVYGHHMEKKAMFGEIGEFADKAMFDSHQYGNIYYNGEDRGIEFFAFVHTDAYDTKVFTTKVYEEDEKQAYLDHLYENAVYTRDMDISLDDNLILLSTCSSSSTNGRDILVGRITGNTFDDPTPNTDTNDKKKISANSPYCIVDGISVWMLLLIAAVALRLVILLIQVIHYKWNQRKSTKEDVNWRQNYEHESYTNEKYETNAGR